MYIERVTYILLVIVTAAFAFSSPFKTASTKKEQEENLQKATEARSKFPLANYDEAEPTDPVKKAARKEKQKRYDGPSIVARNPHPSDAEVGSVYEGPELPALPTSKSNVIVVGTVRSGEAHLSNDKKNIYSEFTVEFDDVLKAEVALPTNNILTIDREGGIVAYPNGQQILYRNSRENMPSVGKRYVFFLKHVHQDFRILTAYQLDGNKVVPLDDFAQFKKFASQDVTTFLDDVRTILSKPNQPVGPDLNDFPMVNFDAPEPDNLEVRLARRAKGRKYSKRFLPRISESTDQLYSSADWDRGLPAIPTAKSSAIVIGTVVSAEAYLTQDKTAIYSEFTVYVDTVMKNDLGVPLDSRRRRIIVERNGGRVLMRSGKIIVSWTSHQKMPQLGSSYAFFLTHDFETRGDTGKDFYLLTAYLIQGGRVFPLDDTASGAAYKDATESSFLNDLWWSVERPK